LEFNQNIIIGEWDSSLALGMTWGCCYMNSYIYSIKNKRQDLLYASTLNNVELPILDITHPLFISSINEVKLKKMLLEAGKNADKTAEKFNSMPAFLKKFLANHSFTMSELLQNKGDNAYLSGVSTLMLKLGPGLIGKGKNRFLERLASGGIGGIVLRMRVRDISTCQSNALIQILRNSPEKNLYMINIAGGAASDSINTLFLIQKEDPGLLENRKIELDLLDLDTFGPAFAENCITELKARNGRFYGLDISLRNIHYDWNNPEVLEKVLKERKDWIISCSSEGGLFEYCTDEVIEKNLDTLFENSNSELIITGSLLHDIKNVDAGIIASLKISTNIKPRFLGLDGLKRICKSKWVIDNIIEGNPRYLVFRLKKSGQDNL
jgi:hypothetical protein